MIVVMTSPTAKTGPGADQHETACLHCSPPVTPASFYRGRGPLLLAIGLLLAFVATAAAIHSGWLLLRWDLPIQRFVEDHRNAHLTTLFRVASRLGSTVVVVTVTALLAIVTWRRCRAVSIAIVVAGIGRSLLEFVLKDVVSRDRPDLVQLVNGKGFSFPSGHVMAAIALYGLVPLVVALFTRSRALWWASVAASGLVIVAIAASRVYLGVHWFSDVVGSLLLGSFFLLGVEAVFNYTHRSYGCRERERSARETTPSRAPGEDRDERLDASG
jgi:undecaprenyl-diphosphatase